MAYFRKRGNKWSFTMDAGRDPLTGKRKQVTRSGFKTKKEASEEAARITSELKTGEYQETSIRFSDVVTLWLEEKETNCRPSTLYSYKRALKAQIMPEFEKKIVSNIKPIDVHNFYQKLLKNGLTTKYISYVDGILKQILDKAVSFEIINSNPAKKTKRPKVQKVKQESWTVDQANTFLAAAKLTAKHYIAYYLALHTGMRIGEILGLKWSDIQNKQIHVQRTITLQEGRYTLGDPKTYSSNRFIPISDETASALEEHKKNQKNNPLDLVVCTSKGNIMWPYTLRYQMKSLCEKLDLPLIRFHDLRRTHTSILMDLGVNPKVISERLGHSNVDITFNIYTDTYEKQHVEATKKIQEILKSGQNVVRDTDTE
ncbi:tyrosine-type recombinase/integrase [Bacillus infantis]|uniref:site-specific integrase n=1 Tax=Bacillus infantis TaxID=324767 RepID=UPI0020059065|nr:tyrosine-type recombinase/integrase [Bacillus infantis]MCK6203978.1 tyrosine-type recombinase/integrase [Bacillus infantis]